MSEKPTRKTKSQAPTVSEGESKKRERQLAVGDLPPKRDPKGGCGHDVPPGHARKTGGRGGA